MRLRRLELEEFRSHRRLELDLEPAGLRVVGRNASGKSSLLEAIAMLATTRSPRAGTDRDTIGWSSGADLAVAPYARLRGVFSRRDGDVEIEIGLQLDPTRNGALRKSVQVNGRAVRAIDAVGRVKAVLFGPEDVAMLAGSPSGRRRYLDLTISQTDPSYLRSLARYGRVLEQRNSLLKSLQRERAAGKQAAAAQLAFWDEELLLHGGEIIVARDRTVRRLAEIGGKRHRELTGQDLALTYLPSLASAEPTGNGAADEGWLQGRVRREFAAALADQRDEEIRRGVSVVGPHRDDFEVASNGISLGRFGSRGQQRLAVIALKLAETDLMTAAAGEAPLLLLDDVLSELDTVHRRHLEDAAASIGAQTIVTATAATDWSGSIVESLPTVELISG